VHVHEVIDQALRFATASNWTMLMPPWKNCPRRTRRQFPLAALHPEKLQDGYYVSRVYPRHTMEKWRDAGEPSATQVLREKTIALLESAPAPRPR